MHPVLLVLYLLEGVIFAVTGYLVGRKHTPFPDCRIGLHVKDAMKSSEAWERANRLAGLLCAACAAGFLLAGVSLHILKIGSVPALLLLLGLSAVCVPAVVLVPAACGKRE